MTIDDVPSVFDRKYTYHCYRIPDKRLMQQAAEKLTGRHDFRNFSSAKKTKSTVREIFDIDIYGDIEEMQILIEAAVAEFNKTFKSTPLTEESTANAARRVVSE